MAAGTVEGMAGRLRWIIWTMMAFSVAVYLLAQFRLDIGGNPLITAGAANMAPPAVVAIRHVSAALALLAMWQLTLMLELIMRGDRFSPAVVRKLRHFALVLFVSAILSFLAGLIPLLSNRYPTFINLRELWYMIATGGLFLVARLLEDAARIQVELAEIV